nr:hypothetical protein [Angustibacter aerolatus]
MTVIDDVVERNRRYAETFDSRGLGAPPVRQARRRHLHGRAHRRARGARPRPG